jgi:tRNA (cytidine/uridine-2'-O-)-methyltransferase
MLGAVSGPLFHVVLHEPEIPNNTGAIGRTCIGTGCALHLIRPFGFETSEKALRRAGLDYWPRLGVREHADWDSYLRASGARDEQLWIYTTKAARPHWDAPTRRGDHLVFGKETRGLPDSFLARYPDRLVTLPMSREERSLNLANVACAAVYEGLRQLVARGEVTLDSQGRLTPSGGEA